jgi:hypothetical protein
MGWTYEEFRRQPLGYVYLLAADALLESESISEDSPSPSRRPAPGASSEPRERVIRYTLRPSR